MKVNIKIIFAEDYYPFEVNWKLPFFPSVGDVLELDDILSTSQLEYAKKIKFHGSGKFEGLNINLFQVIYGSPDCKVVSISWMKEQVDLFIENENYSKKGEFWCLSPGRSAAGGTISARRETPKNVAGQLHRTRKRHQNSNPERSEDGIIDTKKDS